jgi:hypothetical protein
MSDGQLRHFVAVKAHVTQGGEQASINYNANIRRVVTYRSILLDNRIGCPREAEW